MCVIEILQEIFTLLDSTVRLTIGVYINVYNC